MLEQPYPSSTGTRPDVIGRLWTLSQALSKITRPASRHEHGLVSFHIYLSLSQCRERDLTFPGAYFETSYLGHHLRSHYPPRIVSACLMHVLPGVVITAEKSRLLLPTRARSRTPNCPPLARQWAAYPPAIDRVVSRLYTADSHSSIHSRVPSFPFVSFRHVWRLLRSLTHGMRLA